MTDVHGLCHFTLFEPIPRYTRGAPDRHRHYVPAWCRSARGRRAASRSQVCQSRRAWPTRGNGLWQMMPTKLPGLPLDLQRLPVPNPGKPSLQRAVRRDPGLRQLLLCCTARLADHAHVGTYLCSIGFTTTRHLRFCLDHAFDIRNVASNPRHGTHVSPGAPGRPRQSLTVPLRPCPGCQVPTLELWRNTSLPKATCPPVLAFPRLGHPEPPVVRPRSRSRIQVEAMPVQIIWPPSAHHLPGIEG